MRRQFSNLYSIKALAVLSLFMFAVVGCSSNGDLATEVSGKWQTEQGSGRVDIHLAKDASSLTIDGRTFHGVVEKIDKGTDTVHVKVETEGGDTEVWSIHQVWNDNGSAFKLNLRRNGTSETLIPVGHS